MEKCNHTTEMEYQGYNVEFKFCPDCGVQIKFDTATGMMLNQEEPALKADGFFDKAIIGTASRCGQMTLVAYDVDKCIEVLMDQGMSDIDAIEFFDYNVIGSWVGEGTPIFIYPGDAEEVFERIGNE